MKKLLFESLGKVYPNGVRAVRDFNLEVEEGEFIVLVGPSGCGKSTLLRMIAGLEAITTGRLQLDGREVNAVPPRDRDVAMVFQSYALYPHMTVEENMGISLVLRKADKKAIAEKVRETAELLDISDLLGRKPDQLSGGQRQRVALGRAIVRQPSVFLLDEPLSNLDAALRGQMRLELISLHKRLGATFIYVTHDQTEAMTMGDRIVVMDKGLIQQVGTPEELYRRPCSPFVAGFIGTPQINLIDCVVERRDGGAFACFEGFRVPLAPDCGLPDGPAILGIRPEDVVPGEGDLAARVELIEMTGGDSHVHLRAGGIRLTLKCSSRLRFSAGQEVAISLPADRLLLFARENAEE